VAAERERGSFSEKDDPLDRLGRGMLAAVFVCRIQENVRVQALHPFERLAVDRGA